MSSLVNFITKDEAQIEYVTSVVIDYYGHNKKYDIYKKNIILEFGGFCFNNLLIKKSIKILSEYYHSIQKNNNFNIYIIDKITDYFKNKNIPFELIENIESLKNTLSSTTLNNFERSDIEKKILKKYEYNIEKSTNNYIKLMSIRKK